MPDQVLSAEQNMSDGHIFCMHCGTKNPADSYSCDRCGERVYVPDPNHPPPLGFAGCPKCNTANESHASYCAKCGKSMASAVRISPQGTVAREQVAHSPARAERAAYRGDRAPSTAPSDRQQHRPVHRTPGDDTRDDRNQHAPSGEVNDSGKQGARLPASLRGWNWGAFLMPPIWGAANQVWIGLLWLVPFLIPGLPITAGLLFAMGFAVYLGLRGNELAWSAKKWRSVEHFKRTQQAWLTWGVILNVVMVIIIMTMSSNNGG